MSKVKVLFIGSVKSADAATALLTKMAKVASKGLQVAFGSCSNGAALDVIKSGEVPIPLYLQDTNETLSQEAMEQQELLESPCFQLAKNLFVLRDRDTKPVDLSPGMWRIPVDKRNHLVVASVPPQFRESPEFFERTTKNVSYTGCDILLSTEWPQGIEQLVTEVDSSNLVSYDLASLALQVRAHYHVSFVVPQMSSQKFIQSPAFRHAPSVTSTVTVRHTGRFLALASVGSTSSKWLHAVGVVPIHQEATMGSISEVDSAAPCPYLDLVGPGATATNAGISEETARRLIAQGRGDRVGKRGRHDHVDEPVDPENRSLFVYGLHQDVTRRLQENDACFLDALQGSLRVRRPTGSAFAFIDFSTHEEASRNLGEQSILGVKLAFRWARGVVPQKRKRQRLTEAEAKDSSTVYFKVAGTKKGEASINASTVGESLRATLESTLENALGEGVKASDEPALQVKLRLPESETSFGFCDFASHAAGSMALATLTGSTDGGLIELPEDATEADSPLNDAILYLHWAQPLQANMEEKNVVESNGFKFERRHFPADARSDCWFCLASKDCEKHLIVGVYDSFYAAMPKGPVHPGHVLLVPVHHSSEGALLDSQLSNDLDLLKQDLREHAHATYNAGLFVFERAIGTKGGYHTHIQCIPIAHDFEDQIAVAMQQQLDHLGLECQEVPADKSPSSLVQDDGQYFYAETPAPKSTGACKRFVVLQSATQRVPLQFGREVIASVLQKPDLAHWKSCLTDKEQETVAATEFRKSFQQYLDSK